MLKILQARLQQYVNWELPGVQAGFRKGRTIDQLANIQWILAICSLAPLPFLYMEFLDSTTVEA